MKPALPDAGLSPRPEDRDTTASARPSLAIDAAQGLILDANAAAWGVWGLDPAPAALPVAIDRAMPALRLLSGLACARHAHSTERLVFWTPRGVRHWRCRVRRVQPGQSVYLVEVIEEGADKSLGPLLNGTAAHARQREATATAKLAHELRTPLSAVIAYAEVLKDEHFGALGNARYRDYARNIYDSARHALEVVDGMLASSPGAGGLPELAFADLDPARIVAHCLAVARPLAEQAGLELVAEVAPRVPRIVADEVSLKQMLLNLLTNAIKFARRGDRVTLTVTYDLDQALRIAVADTGPGMEGPLPALQGDKAGSGCTTGHHAAGLGIGLPLTRALAEANGATLLIASAPERGTCVTIMFGKDRIVPV